MEINPQNLQSTTFNDKNSASSSSLPVEVRKDINAPASAVFAARADSDQIRMWWGPESFDCPFAKLDFRVGGNFLFSMRGPQGEEIWTTGTFKDIIPDKKIVCSDFPANKDGEIISAEEAGFKGPYADIGEATIIVELSEKTDRQF